MAFLVVVKGPLKGQRFDIEGETTRIGRRAGNDWVLEAPSISGTHCEIVRIGPAFHLRDLGSTNGTRLNGKKIQESRLNRNDTISVSDVSFTIDGDDVPDPTAIDSEVIPRTAIMIRPQVSGNARVMLSPHFRRRIDTRKLWIAIIALTGLAVLVAAFFFLRYQLSVAP